MNEAQKRTRGQRKARDFDSEIAEAEAKLKSLIAAKKAQAKMDRSVLVKPQNSKSEAARIDGS